jgi:hypothetical protein
MLESERTYRSVYSRKLRPPTMSAAPIDCENGTLSLRLELRGPGQPRLHSIAGRYRYTPSGDLETLSYDDAG